MSKMIISDSAYGTYFFDTTFKEMPSFTNQITQNPVQTGAAINDHLYHQPITLTIDVGVSDVVTSFSSSCFASGARSIDAFAYFEKLWEGGNALTIGTESCTYKNMVVKSFTPLKDKTTMHVFRATVTFQQIIVTDAVAIGVSQKKTADPQTTGKTNAGTKATSTSDYKASAYLTGAGGYGVGGSGTTSEADR